MKDNFTHGANAKIHGNESFLKRGNAVLGVVSLQNIDSVTTMAVSFTRSLTIWFFLWVEMYDLWYLLPRSVIDTADTDQIRKWVSWQDIPLVRLPPCNIMCILLCEGFSENGLQSFYSFIYIIVSFAISGKFFLSFKKKIKKEEHV